MDTYTDKYDYSIDDIDAVDKWAREYVEKIYQR